MKLTRAHIDEVLRAVGEEPAATAFAAVATIAQATCGFRMLTVLRYDEPAGEVVRLYSSDPAYPVGGRKSLAAYTLNHAVMAADGCFLAADADSIRRAFADHERLFALGITAILNAQVRVSGRRLGTLNLSGTQGQYGAEEVATARLLAGLIAPLLAVNPPDVS
jgi:GAF domain-containing protein